MAEIVAHNTEAIHRAVGRLSADHYDRLRARLPKAVERRLVLPDLSEVLPKRSVHIRKAAERGKLLTDDLRAKLSNNLRQVLKDFPDQPYIIRRGAKRGRINPELTDLLEARLVRTFSSYTRRDPYYGVPANVRTIATTEVRSAASATKWEYVQRLKQRNPELRILKRWKHNKHLSEQPREHHMAADGQTRDIDDRFTLQRREKGKGGRTRYVTVRLAFPHDPEAAPEEVINCHCDFDVLVTAPKGRKA
jgi:hypothetical protein